MDRVDLLNGEFFEGKFIVKKLSNGSLIRWRPPSIVESGNRKAIESWNRFRKNQYDLEGLFAQG